MIKKILILSFIFTLLLAACAPAATPTEAPAQPTEAPAQPTEAPPEPTEPAMPSGEVVVATPGQALNMVFLPKNLGNAVFDEAHEKNWATQMNCSTWLPHLVLPALNRSPSSPMRPRRVSMRS